MNTDRALASLYRSALPLMLSLQVVGFFGSAPMAALAQEPVQARSASEVFAQSDFLTLTNDARREQGLAPLVLNDQLHAAALAKAEDMAAKGYWDHFRPGDNKAPWAFIQEEGYDYKVAGENLARGFRTPSGITVAWLNSPTHRANLLSERYTEVGFASVRTTDANGTVLLLTVQMFGSR